MSSLCFSLNSGRARCAPNPARNNQRPGKTRLKRGGRGSGRRQATRPARTARTSRHVRVRVVAPDHPHGPEEPGKQGATRLSRSGSRPMIQPHGTGRGTRRGSGPLRARAHDCPSLTPATTSEFQSGSNLFRLRGGESAKSEPPSRTVTADLAEKRLRRDQNAHAAARRARRRGLRTSTPRQCRTYCT